MSGRIVVVIPTYNEKGNLPVLAEKIFGLNIPGLSLLVVDDNSPDGTAACAEELAKRFPIRILRRTRKEGIGKAYIQAFQTLLTDPSPPDRIIQMDADMSHDPARIPA
ncbi:MAG: glycosyltransferase, partial [Candidatus Sungbacteria bacterium]|nr:glycosyltransferase [Candidatus Sungbacteria bacterium]